MLGKTRNTMKSSKWNTWDKSSSKYCQPLNREDNPQERINAKNSDSTSKKLRKSAKNKPSRESPQLIKWDKSSITRSNMPTNNTNRFWNKKSPPPNTLPKRKRTPNTQADYTLVLPVSLLKVTELAFHTTKFLSQWTEVTSMNNWDSMSNNTKVIWPSNKTSNECLNESGLGFIINREE